MKKQSIFAICAIAGAIALSGLESCSKLGDLLKKDLEMQTTSVDFVIPPSSDTTIALTGSQTNYYNIDSFIKASTGNILGVANIKSAKIKGCVITINNPSASINFSNFRNITGSFHTEAEPTEYRMSIANNPDVNVSTLSLPVDSSAELKGYLNSNQFTYTVSGQLRRPVADSVHCTARITFSVRVEG